MQVNPKLNLIRYTLRNEKSYLAFLYFCIIYLCNALCIIYAFWSIYSWKLNILLSYWKQCCIIFFMEMVILFFRILWWIQSSKETHLFETEILCNILNISTVTFTNWMHLFTNIWHMYKLCYTKLNMSPKNKYTASKKDSFLKKSIYHCSTICVMLSWIYDYL